ncbi:MAG: small acid-soluble spore protein SspI [bacterium]|nr:small acid-soluble spore protein SspI [bacterium]
MDLDIRKNVIEKIKNDDEKTIIDTLNESVVTGNELVLPGLGVMLEIFWNELKNEEKENIARIIKEKVRETN